jgi:hypothetical protein
LLPFYNRRHPWSISLKSAASLYGMLYFIYIDAIMNYIRKIQSPAVNWTTAKNLEFSRVTSGNQVCWPIIYWFILLIAMYNRIAIFIFLISFILNATCQDLPLIARCKFYSVYNTSILSLKLLLSINIIIPRLFNWQCHLFFWVPF